MVPTGCYLPIPWGGGGGGAYAKWVAGVIFSCICDLLMIGLGN